MQYKLLAPLVLGMCALAQQATDVFDKAPSEVDQALRDRVSKFYQAHVEGKFRQAEQYVAEDSKDTYYEMDKKRYFGFEIVKLVYEENYTKANVVTAVDMEWRTPRLGAVRVKAPISTKWKIDNGQWCWYVIPQDSVQTPFGMMKDGPDDPTRSAPMSGPRWIEPSVVQSGVKADRQGVRLSTYETLSGAVRLTNTVPGVVKLEVMYTVTPGLSAKFEKTELKQGESTDLTFTYEPKQKIALQPMTATVRISPTNQEIPIRLEFALPPEVDRLMHRTK